MKPKRTATQALPAALAAALLLAGCGSSVIAESEIESDAAAQLAEETGQPEPDIDCPGDLEAEVGASMECELTADGLDGVYPVTVEVTSVEGDRANYSVQVGDEPIGGDSGDADFSEEPADTEAPAEEDPATEDTAVE